MSLTGALRFLVKSKMGETKMLKPGDAAPDFSAKDAYGRDVKLKDYRGKNVVLWFFPKANTSG